VLTHGHLPENNNHGGSDIGLPDMSKSLAGPVAPRQVTIEGFVYSQGDMGLTGKRGRPPVIAQGQTLRFVNKDAKNAKDSWETPKTLPQGTYTYFCRIHPFMRGAFRVKGSTKES